LIADFLTPEELEKEHMSSGIVENVKISFDLDTEELEKAWKCSPTDFNHFLKRQYPYLMSTLKLHFEAFISAEPLSPPPKLDKNFILTRELQRMLMLVNPKFQLVRKLHLLYSTKVHGQSFNKLVSNISGWPATAIVLLKCTYRDIKGDNRSSVFGAMTFCQLTDKYGYFGNHNTVLFSLKPFFKIIKTKTGKRSNSYIYLNSMASGQK
jgi:hypothetical protein